MSEVFFAQTAVFPSGISFHNKVTRLVGHFLEALRLGSQKQTEKSKQIKRKKLEDFSQIGRAMRLRQGTEKDTG